MLDYTELSDDGADLELLVREIVISHGFEVRWSGKGPDAGCDLVCIERRDSYFKSDQKKWLIQCKHNAQANKAVGVNDVDDIVDTCNHHHCKGYLLVCSTYPSSTLVQKLEGVSTNPNNDIEATYWDATRLEQLLSTAKSWPLAQRFFPISAEAQNWKIYATESPNHWVVNYRGYYFYLSNRVGSKNEFVLGTVRQRVTEMEAIALPTGHCLRLRAVYFDDKHGHFTWYLDYMFPSGESPRYSATWIARALGDDYALEDGQVHSFDVINRSYRPYSDHHDFDHYDYYHSHNSEFLHGSERPRDRIVVYEEESKLNQQLESRRNDAYQALVLKFSEIDCARLVQSSNSEVEYLDRFYKQFDWSRIIQHTNLATDRFFSAWFQFDVDDEERFHTLVSYFPQEAQHHFRLKRPITYLPGDTAKRSVRSGNEGECLYELTFAIHPQLVANKTTGRDLLNAYFQEVMVGIQDYQDDHAN